MASPLSPKDAVKQAEEELRTQEVATFFGFFNLEGESLGDDVAEVFVKDGLLNDEGQPLAGFTQLFQLAENKKNLEAKIRKAAIPTFVANLVSQRLAELNLAVLPTYHLLIRGICQQITDLAKPFIDNLPDKDFLPANEINQVASEIHRYIDNLTRDRTGTAGIIQFLLDSQYAEKKVIFPVTQRLTGEIENTLKSINVSEIANCFTFYVSVSLEKSKLLIDLNYYNLQDNPVEIVTIERYQIEAITYDDRLRQFEQEDKNFQETLQQAIDLSEVNNGS